MYIYLVENVNKSEIEEERQMEYSYRSKLLERGVFFRPQVSLAVALCVYVCILVCVCRNSIVSVNI